MAGESGVRRRAIAERRVDQWLREHVQERHAGGPGHLAGREKAADTARPGLLRDRRGRVPRAGAHGYWQACLLARNGQRQLCGTTPQSERGRSEGADASPGNNDACAEEEAR